MGSFVPHEEEPCILIIGAPASGKGTQSEKIEKLYNFYHISSGDLLRAEVTGKTELGLKAKSYMDSGKLVPDALIFGMIEKVLAKPECKRAMFDGFPRNLEQAKTLDEMLRRKGKKLVGVIYLDVPDEAIVARATGRRVHPASGRTYHVLFNPPKVADRDDVTGEPLIQRSDDTEEVAKKRLVTFHENNEPVIRYYEGKQLLWRIAGTGAVNEIWQQIDPRLSAALASKKEGLRFRLSGLVNRRPFTSQPYARKSFERMRAATDSDPAGITEMALRNRYQEMAEGNWAAVTTVSGLMTVYTLMRMRRFKSMGVGGQLFSGIGLVLGGAGLIWSNQLRMRLAERKAIDKNEVLSNLAPKKN